MNTDRMEPLDIWGGFTHQVAVSANGNIAERHFSSRIWRRECEPNALYIMERVAHNRIEWVPLATIIGHPDWTIECLQGEDPDM